MFYGANSKSTNSKEEVMDGTEKTSKTPQLITVRTGGLCRPRMNSVHIYLAWKEKLFSRPPFHT